MNETWIKTLGYSKDDVIGKSIFDFVAEDERDNAKSSFHKKLQSKTTYSVANNRTYLTKNGDKLIFEISDFFSFDEGNNVIAVYTIMNDITDLIKAEKEKENYKVIQETTKRLHKVVNEIEDGITLSDPEGRFEIFNAKMQEITGYTIEEVNRCGDFTTLLYPELQERKKALDNIHETTQTGLSRNIETTIQTKNSVKKTLMVSTSMIKLDDRDMFLSVYHDITERKQMETQLRELSTVVEQTVEGIAIADLDGNITFSNSAWNVMHGYDSKDNLRGQNLSIFHTKEQLEIDVKPFNEVLRGRGANIGEVGHKRKDGTTFPTWMTTTVLKDDKGRPYSMAGIAQDITERKKIQEEIRKSEEKYRELFNNVLIGIDIHNSDGSIFAVNKTAEKTFGISEKELKKKDLSFWKGKLIKPDGTEMGSKDFPLSIVGKTKKPSEGAIVGLKMSEKESVRWFLHSARPVLDENKNIDNIVTSFVEITERKKTEEKLKESEERYRLLMQNSDAAISLFDKHGNFTLINNIGAKRLGKKPEEIIGKSLYDFWPKEESDKHFKRFQKIMNSGKSDDFEDSIDVPTGKFTFYTSIQPTRDAQGKIIGVQLISHDITERKQREREVKYLKEYNENILESNPSPMMVVKGKQIEYVNKSFIFTFGKTRKDYISKELKEVIPAFKKLLQDQNKMKELEIKGKSFSVNSFIVKKAEEEEEERIGLILQDITELKKVEEKIRKSEEKFRSMIEITSDWVWEVDKNGIYTYASPKSKDILGYNPEEIIGKTPFDLMLKSEVERVSEAFKAAIESKKPILQIENTNLHKNGQRIVFETSGVPFFDDTGKLLGYRGIDRDITDRKKSEEVFKKYQKEIELQNIKLKRLDKIKSDFLNITSHELRTPMSAIKGYVQMILKQTLGDVTEEQKKALNTILRNTNRLDNLIQDILDISRLESGTMKFIPEQTKLDKMISEAIDTMIPYADIKKIRINPDFGNKIPELIIDQERVKQVIINIVNNAIKFSPDGSIINIRAKKQKHDVLFEIEDFGRGIPKDKQDKVFDTFYQVDGDMDRKFGGAGLGLAICRGIVISHGGNIWVESQVRKGSTFKFTLPIKSVKDIESRFREIDIFGLQTNEKDTN